MMRQLVEPRLAAVGHDIIILRLGDRPDTILVQSSEEVVPRFEALVLGLGIAMEHVIESVVGLGSRVGDLFERLDALFSKPSFVFGGKDRGRCGRHEVFTPNVEDFLHLRLDIRVHVKQGWNEDSPWR